MVLAMVSGTDDGGKEAAGFNPLSLRRIIAELCHEVRLGFGRCLSFSCVLLAAAAAVAFVGEFSSPLLSSPLLVCF